MVDITIVNIWIIIAYKPTYNWGAQLPQLPHLLQVYNPPRSFADFSSSDLAATDVCCDCGGGVDCSDSPFAPRWSLWSLEIWGESHGKTMESLGTRQENPGTFGHQSKTHGRFADVRLLYLLVCSLSQGNPLSKSAFPGLEGCRWTPVLHLRGFQARSPRGPQTGETWVVESPRKRPCSIPSHLMGQTRIIPNGQSGCV